MGRFVNGTGHFLFSSIFNDLSLGNLFTHDCVSSTAANLPVEEDCFKYIVVKR